jgi:hypothetical protein
MYCCVAVTAVNIMDTDFCMHYSYMVSQQPVNRRDAEGFYITDEFKTKGFKIIDKN